MILKSPRERWAAGCVAAALAAAGANAQLREYLHGDVNTINYQLAGTQEVQTIWIGSNYS